MDSNYSGDSDGGSGGSTPVQDENDDIDEDYPAEGEDVTVSHSPAASPKEDGVEYNEGEVEDGERREDSEDEEWRGETEHTQASEEVEAVSEAESERGSEDGEVPEELEDADENVEEQREVEEEAEQAVSDQEDEEIQEPASPLDEEIQEPASPPDEDIQEPVSPPDEEIQEPVSPPDEEIQEPVSPPDEEIQEPASPPDEEIQEPVSPPDEEIQEPASPPDLHEEQENSYDQEESEQKSDGEMSEDGREERKEGGEGEDISEEEQEQREERVERQVEEDEDEQVDEEGEEVERTMEETVQDTPLSPASDTPLSPVSEIASPEQFDEDQAEPVAEEDEEEKAEHEREEEAAESGDEEQRVEREDERSQQAGHDGDTEMYEGAEQVSDAEDEEGDGYASEVEDGAEEQKSTRNRRRVLDSDDEDAPLQVAEEETPASPEADQGDNVDDEEVGETQAKKDVDSGEESDEEKELIADIFGSSDEEGEDFEGFGENDLEPASKKKKSAILSSDEDDDGEPAGGAMDADEEEQEAVQEEESAQDQNKEAAGSDSDDGLEPQKGYQRADFVSDFDLMMEKKKAEMGRRRKRRDVDIINDNDDIVMAMITQMKEAAEADHELNKGRKAAVKKLLMYPKIMQQLQKADLQQTLLECGILSAMKEWLMPLPDKSLPHLKIRSSFLKVLRSFPPISQDLLKSSGIGKAVMILYRHPKELRMNKDLAGRIINNWSRPIFGVDDSFLAMSKEERQHRDLAQLSAVKRRRMSSQEGERPKSIDKALQQGEKALRPGDKGWIGRARVPMPSNKDYLVRPKSAIEAEFSARNFRKPPPSKLDKQLKKMKASRAKSRNPNARAINVNIAGAKMSL